MSITTPYTARLYNRSIGPLEATVTEEENHTDKTVITSHPVQSGTPIMDHAYDEPAELTVKVGFAPGGVPLDLIYENLNNLRKLHEPFEVVTGKRAYPSMLIETLGVTTNKETENVLSVSITFKEIITAEVTTVSIPPRKVQKIPAKTASTENAGPKTPVKQSALKTLAGGFGG